MPPSTGIPRLVVSVDFGTKFSSVAYAYSECSENLEVIHDWPGSGNRTSHKVPTEILYLDTESGAVRTCADGKRRYQWGYGINLEGRRNAEPLKWFKLLLHDRNPSLRFGSYGSSLAGQANTPATRTATQLTRLGLSPVEVATDFLQSVREHTIAILERRFTAEFINKTKIQYILTVPAVCSDSATALTLQAARNAGFGEHGIDFNLIGEPEAIIAYTLKAIQPNILNEGDTFVVCDAGGETVDLASYKIESLNPLSVSEVVAGSGGLCGSVFLNEQFEEHVRDLLGDDTIDRMRPIGKREMMRQWEEKVKFKFADEEEVWYYEVYIPGVPDNEEKGLEAGFLSLSRAQVKRIFDPVIDRIVELVDEEIRNVRKKGGNVSAILLFGGFGALVYLHKRLREQVFFGGKVEVMQPRNAWNAIARGAVIQGLNCSFVKEIIVRRHYGVSTVMDYREGRGLERYRCWNVEKEMWEIPNQMIWFLNKGTVITKDSRIAFPYCPIIKRGCSLLCEIELLACNYDKAPAWNDPQRVFPVATFNVDLSILPFNRFDMFRDSKGVEYLRVNFSLEMSISSGEISFSLMSEGKCYGRPETKFL